MGFGSEYPYAFPPGGCLLVYVVLEDGITYIIYRCLIWVHDYLPQEDQLQKDAHIWTSPDIDLAYVSLFAGTWDPHGSYICMPIWVSPDIAHISLCAGTWDPSRSHMGMPI